MPSSKVTCLRCREDIRLSDTTAHCRDCGAIRPLTSEELVRAIMDLAGSYRKLVHERQSDFLQDFGIESDQAANANKSQD